MYIPIYWVFTFICIYIISESESFVDVLEKLHLKDNKDADEIFIISLKKFIKDFFIARDIEDIKNKDAVLITTPYSYIANNIDRKIQIWVDIGSNTWNMKIEKDSLSEIIFLHINTLFSPSFKFKTLSI